MSLAALGGEAWAQELACPAGTRVRMTSLEKASRVDIWPDKDVREIQVCGIELRAPGSAQLHRCAGRSDAPRPFRVVDRHGSVLASGACKAGKPHGDWRYSAFGKPRWERQYRDGELHGHARTWDERGALREEGRYHEGHRVGVWRFPYGSGQTRTVNYGPRTRASRLRPVF